MVFNVAIFATYILIKLWITFEYVWFVDATFWTRKKKKKNNDVHEVGKVEN
jgi:hypothetical protein